MTKEELRARLGANIQKQRIVRRMSRSALGKKLNVAVSTIGLMERGERGVTFLTLYKLADVFEVPIDVFFYETGSYAYEDSKRRKLKGLANILTGLSERQLDYVTQMVKGIRDLEQSSE